MQKEPSVITGLKSFVNIYFIKNRSGYIMVDTGIDRGAVDKAFKNTGISPSKITHIILTHGHQDHYGGAAYAREITGAKIIAHELASAAMKEGSSEALKTHDLLGRLLLRMMPSKNVTPVIPDIRIDSSVLLKDTDPEIRIIPTPGHSKGSLSVSVGTSEIIIGDLLRGGRRKLKFSIWYDDAETAFSSIRKILKVNPEKIYLSHGGTVSAENLRNFLKKHA